MADKKTVTPIRGAQTALRGLPDGKYTLEWWDTWKGEVTARAAMESKGGVLSLRLPDIATDFSRARDAAIGMIYANLIGVSCSIAL